MTLRQIGTMDALYELAATRRIDTDSVEVDEVAQGIELVWNN